MVSMHPNPGATNTLAASAVTAAADPSAQPWPPTLPMPKTDAYESELLEAFDKGALKSVATKAEWAKFKAAARATALKDMRVNIRLSSGDLQDFQVKAQEQGMPYQALIASVMHKYVTGKLAVR